MYFFLIILIPEEMHRHNTVEFQSQVVALAVCTVQQQWFEVHYFLF